MRKLLLVPLMTLAISSAPLFATGKGECKCDHKCAESCTKHEKSGCKCEACECAKTGKCEHSKGGHDHGKKEEKTEEKKQ